MAFSLNTVALVGCGDYASPLVEGAVRRVVDLLGGMEAFVKPGQRVLLKPNLLSAHVPEDRVTTDPTVVRAVARMVLDVGGTPFIGDSPALASLRKIVGPSGYGRRVPGVGPGVGGILASPQGAAGRRSRPTGDSSWRKSCLRRMR